MVDHTAVNSIETDFEFHLELTDQQGHVLRDCCVSRAELQRARHCTTFDALQQGILPEYIPDLGQALIEPIFITEQEARAAGFRVRMEYPQQRSHWVEFQSSYFKAKADRIRAGLVRDSVMDAGDELYYRMTAVLADQYERPNTPFPIVVESIADAVPMQQGSRRACGPAEPWDSPLESDLPVLVARNVIEETIEEAEGSPDLEVAGFLFGHLMSDETSCEKFLYVTGAGSCAGTTQASQQSVTYTPESFARASELLKLRGGTESIVGWYHSHPFRFCAKCPLPAPPECIEKVLFYSLDDIHLMETTFDQPFMVGLLVAVEPKLQPAIGHLPAKLYGWRRGEIKARGFDVVDINIG